MSVFDRYLEQAKDFARKLVRAETGTRRWATVTAIDPVRITYDGTTTQGIIPPVVLGTPVTLGDRVRAHTIGGQTYITRANPTSAGVPFAVARGTVSLGLSNEPGKTAQVSFPPGVFTVPPHVMVSRGSAGVAKMVPYSNASTVSGVTVGVYAGDGSNQTGTAVVKWTAVQQTPTSAEG